MKQTKSFPILRNFLLQTTKSITLKSSLPLQFSDAWTKHICDWLRVTKNVSVLIKERQQSTPLWSHLTRNSDLNSLCHIVCVFFPLLCDSDGKGFLGSSRVNVDSMCSLSRTWWAIKTKERGRTSSFWVLKDLGGIRERSRECIWSKNTMHAYVKFSKN